MNLGVIDRDEYRQYRYWQVFQKLLLPAASGFSVAAALLDGHDVKMLSQIVAAILWLLFVAAVGAGWLVARHMVRDLPSSLQSLLLFSSEAEPGEGDRPGERVAPSSAQSTEA